MTTPSDKLFSIPRLVTLLGSIVVALGSGTGYTFSAYAPQLGARLGVSHTQLNIIGLGASMGSSISGPILGRVVDRNGPRYPLIGAGVCLLLGYLGVRQTYNDGIGDSPTISDLRFALLVACSFFTGLGAHSGITAAINTTAKSFPSSFRATATGIVLSGLGLSAFCFTLLARMFFPGDTSALLLMLAIGTSTAMFIGLLTVKLVPLSRTSSNVRDSATIKGCSPKGAGIFVSEARVTLDSELDSDADFIPLLSQEEESDSSSTIELDLLKGSEGTEEYKDMPDIHGKQLWLTLDFYLFFLITGICGGTGIMYINNVGSISQALYAKQHAVYDEMEAAKWQAAQVSILSVGNFAGRFLIGLFSDFTYTRLHLPRAYSLCVVSFLFVVSQVAAIAISSVETLYISTILLGLAYGSLFGSSPTTMIELFGLAHFSENWGYLSFSPLIGGNLFSLIFGRNLDAHVPTQEVRRSLTSLWTRGLGSDRLCFDGRACYLSSLEVTLVACVVSLGLSFWAGIRDGRRARNARVHV